MPRFHILSTTLNSGITVISAVPITRLDLAKTRADAAGDATLCKSQTVEVREGIPASYRIVERLTRISEDGRWGAWVDRPLTWADLS